MANSEEKNIMDIKSELMTQYQDYFLHQTTGPASAGQMGMSPNTFSQVDEENNVSYKISTEKNISAIEAALNGKRDRNGIDDKDVKMFLRKHEDNASKEMRRKEAKRLLAAKHRRKVKEEKEKLIQSLNEATNQKAGLENSIGRLKEQLQKTDTALSLGKL